MGRTGDASTAADGTHLCPAIRTGTVADLPAVLDLWARSTAPTHTDDRPALEGLLRHDAGSLIVAEDAGAVVGSVVAAWDGWRGTIHRLAVDPSYRRRGLGLRLLEAAEAHLAESGARRLQAVVREDDPAAVGFWESTAGWARQQGQVRFTKG
jgi:ribosomal protein S18 acetylase RimI-like enzyme